MAHERLEQAELGGRQLHGHVVDGGGVRRHIQPQAPRTQNGIVRRRLPAPQYGLDAQQQLLELEGFAHVVIGAATQPGDRIGRVLPRGEQDDGSEVTMLAQVLQELVAIHPRHVDVDDQQVRWLLAVQGQRRHGIGCRRHVVPGNAQRIAEHVAQAGFVVDDGDVWHGCPLGSIVGTRHRRLNAKTALGWPSNESQMEPGAPWARTKETP